MTLKGAWTTKHSRTTVTLTMESAETSPEYLRLHVHENEFPDRHTFQREAQHHNVVIGMLDAADLAMLRRVIDEGLRELEEKAVTRCT